MAYQLSLAWKNRSSAASGAEETYVAEHDGQVFGFLRNTDVYILIKKEANSK